MQAIKRWWGSGLQQDMFLIDGRLSVNQFIKAGDHLCSVCTGWKWKPADNPKLQKKYLEDPSKQYLIYEGALCKKRLTYPKEGEQETVKDEQGEQVVIIHPNENQKQQELKEEDVRRYKMYIIYDDYYHTPRMSFTATDNEGKPISNDSIRQDIQKEYLDKTLTVEKFPFMENVSMATVHPCKHSNVLKSMSTTMIENGQKVESHFALLIFLKFITSVIPTVQFDTTGDLHFN